MGIKLNEAMNVGGLKMCKIIAGKEEILKEVDNFTIMEVHDITRWIEGKELLLTSFFAQKDSNEQKKIIKQLHESKITALAIKPFHYLGEIPKFILEEAKKYNIPIIEIPKDVSYLDILSPVMSAIYNNQSITRNNVEKFNKILREIAINVVDISDFIIYL